MTKLTKEQIAEIKDNADYVYKYSEDVFEYQKDGKWTLIQNGKTLVEEADYIEWHAVDVFKYEKNGEDYKIYIK